MKEMHHAPATTLPKTRCQCRASGRKRTSILPTSTRAIHRPENRLLREGQPPSLLPSRHRLRGPRGRPKDPPSRCTRPSRYSPLRPIRYLASATRSQLTLSIRTVLAVVVVRGGEDKGGRPRDEGLRQMKGPAWRTEQLYRLVAQVRVRPPQQFELYAGGIGSASESTRGCSRQEAAWSQSRAALLISAESPGRGTTLRDNLLLLLRARPFSW